MLVLYHFEKEKPHPLPPRKSCTPHNFNLPNLNKQNSETAKVKAQVIFKIKIRLLMISFRSLEVTSAQQVSRIIPKDKMNVNKTSFHENWYLLKMIKKSMPFSSPNYKATESLEINFRNLRTRKCQNLEEKKPSNAKFYLDRHTNILILWHTGIQL